MRWMLALLDPVDVLHHAAGAPGIEADERAAELDADRRQHLLRPVPFESGDPDLLGREADGMRHARRVASLSGSLVGFEMAADEQAVDDGETDEQQRAAARQAHPRPLRVGVGAAAARRAGLIGPPKRR